MTPLHANILLHYYVSPEPWPEATPVHSEYRADLEKWGLLQPSPVMFEGKDTWKVTPRGDALITVWLTMPHPVCKWIIPAHDL